MGEKKEKPNENVISNVVMKNLRDILYIYINSVIKEMVGRDWIREIWCEACASGETYDITTTVTKRYPTIFHI